MFSGDNGVGFTYNSTVKSLIDFYKTQGAIAKGAKDHLSILIYNGDTDPTINVLTG